jgi:hypothetical protein
MDSRVPCIISKGGKHVHLGHTSLLAAWFPWQLSVGILNFQESWRSRKKRTGCWFIKMARIGQISGCDLN